MAQDTPVQLLDKVKSEIAAYESRKPAQLKSELDGFIKKREALVKDYADQYPAFLAQWTAQDEQVQRHRATLKCRYPGSIWQTVLKAAITTACSGMMDLAGDIRQRSDAARGPREKARDDAKDAALAAEAELQDLQKNAALCKAMLADHQKKLVALGQEIAAPQGSRALGLLWLDLMPEHVLLAPDGADLGFIAGEFPWQLGPWSPDKPETLLPKLIDPALYGDALDAAWAKLDQKRMAYGRAEGAFAAAPDDLATQAATLAAKVGQRSATILSTLQAVQPPAPSDPVPPTPSGASTGPAGSPPPPPAGEAPATGEAGEARQSPADAATRESGTGAGTAAPAGAGPSDGPPVHP